MVDAEAQAFRHVVDFGGEDVVRLFEFECVRNVFQGDSFRKLPGGSGVFAVDFNHIDKYNDSAGNTDLPEWRDIE